MFSISLSKINEVDFLNLRNEWNDLLRKSVTDEPFLLWEWVYSWWETFKDETKTLLILVGRDSDGKIIGIAPLYKEEKRGHFLGKSRAIKFCSSAETAPDHLDVICQKENADYFLDAVFDYLKNKEKDWHVIKLEGIDENSAIKGYVTTKAEGNKSFLVSCLPDSACPFLKIKEDYENYLRSFSRKKRYNLLRERRILLENPNTIFEKVNKDSENYFKELFILHAERAKRKGIETTFAGQKIYNFHKSFKKWSSEEGKVILFNLAEKSQTLASAYCIKHQNKYYYYQTGISNDGEERSAGSVLLSLVIERAFEEGCSEFDFLRGMEEYKYYWTKDNRRNFVIEVRRSSFKDRLIHRGIFFRDRIKMKMRKFLCAQKKGFRKE
jgi:CelD/BcsL family acetyltransferase involved in cellulose biosynthesis